MKFASFMHAGRPGWGVLKDDRVIDLSGIAGSLKEALGRGLPLHPEQLPRERGVALSAVELLPPVPDTGRIFCVGLNYAAHREETGRKPSEYPAIFVRFAPSVVGHGAELLAPPESTQFDYEGELAAVIGKGGRRIAREDALDHVAGYSCFMDGSVRDWQLHTHQYTPGKNFDRSGAFGPCLVSADEVGDPNAGLRLETRLNGRVVQETTTDQMLFDVPAVIAYLSAFTELQPGDVVATGTPGGVGFKRTPPLFMRGGDRVEVEIAKLGILSNPVRAET